MRTSVSRPPARGRGPLDRSPQPTRMTPQNVASRRSQASPAGYFGAGVAASQENNLSHAVRAAHDVTKPARCSSRSCPSAAPMLSCRPMEQPRPWTLPQSVGYHVRPPGKEEPWGT